MYMKAKRVPPSIDNVKYWNLYSDPNLYPKKIAEVTSKIFTDYGHLAPLRKGYLEMEQMLAPIIQNVFLGQTTAEAAMKNVAPRIQAILDRSK
jgi:ABC-type glycerol-3-phosphate transport system substrate-binding protein